MTDPPVPRNEESFHEALTILIERAHNNGTPVEGARKCTTDANGDLHWDVQITRVEYDD
jgi:hypothetical protein